ncbi:hypothetical protein [Rhodococcus qingshengii]|uniref:hypothetical protein n=1 Tax=Rhodococcus qingshengii TaxID=334542 RepID=UPI00237D0ED4|nr:hypothetical protein [Rhodococcus qingshengii]WCT06086.1 hypothetical protein PI247_31295 [Rhodococcus qingshengii]
MNKKQLEDSLQGVRLLTGHMREQGESLDAAIAAQDFSLAVTMTDPLVNVAIILVRQLKTAMQCDTLTALDATRELARPELHEFWDPTAMLITKIVAGEAPPTMMEGPGAIAVGAQEIAACAAELLAKKRDQHPNVVVATLRKQILEQGQSVQLSDKEGVEENMAKYAGDPTMRQSRKNTATVLVKSLNDGVAGPSHNRAMQLHASDEAFARDCYEGLACIAVTAAALGGGMLQLLECNNHYPAYALLRQAVETEFILWKFSKVIDEIPNWLNSNRDDRERSWKPSKIYRDQDNDYRQKDYSGHCEIGGHPTPTGTRLASGERSDIAEASVLGDLIGHLRDSWEHALHVADSLDLKYQQTVPTISADVRQGVADALASWRRTDKYGFSTSYFSDPIN